MSITLDVAARVFERFGEVLELDLRLDLAAKRSEKLDRFQGDRPGKRCLFAGAWGFPVQFFSLNQYNDK